VSATTAVEPADVQGRPEHRRGAQEPGSERATCVFAVVRTGDPAPPAGVRGHADGGPLSLLELDGGLWAVVQNVPAAQFTEEALRRRLADCEELEGCARAHHEVVTAAASYGPVVPLPLATLFSGPARAKAALDSSRARFTAVLDTVEGRAEWAVKVHFVQPAAGSREAEADTDEGPSAAPDPDQADTDRSGGAGRAYLERVRGRERDRRQRRQAAVEAARRVDEAARAMAVSALQRRTHGPEITGRHRQQVMNVAYLVDVGRGRQLTAAVAALRGTCAQAGVEIEISGPWVPYSFCEAGRDGDPA
jgi:hypothetical protein